MLQNHDEVISRLRKMPRFAQRTHEIHGGHAGERPGDHARRDERGRIHQNGRRARGCEMVGEATGRCFKLGMPVRIEVEDCDRFMRTINFRLVDQ